MTVGEYIDELRELNRDITILIEGRDGNFYPPAVWRGSNTFYAQRGAVDDRHMRARRRADDIEVTAVVVSA